MKSSKTNLPVSVLIMTHRSDERFLKCLRSVQFVPEILILDVSSGNDWKNLEKKYMFTVLKKIDHVRNFSRSRNWMIKQASQPWILFIDSDEQVSPDLKTLIPDLVQAKAYAGYYIKRQDFFLGKPVKHGEVGSVFKLRLAQKKRISFDRPIHEKGQVVGITRRVTTPILHVPHTSIKEFWQKIEYYAQLEAEYRSSNGKRFALWELLTFPIGKFALNYIVKLGFLDGFRGFVYAFMMSVHSAFVRIHLYEHTVISTKK